MGKAFLQKNLESPGFRQNHFFAALVSSTERLSQLTGQKGNSRYAPHENKIPVAMTTLNNNNTSNPMTTPRETRMIRIMVVEDNVDYRSVIAMAIDDAVDMELTGLFEQPKLLSEQSRKALFQNYRISCSLICVSRESVGLMLSH